MNCTQAHELLPLHAGRDLDEKRERLVSEHVQICSACARVADEYRETVELAHNFAPPVFTENAYASLRQQVLRQIENEPAAPLLSQMFGSWFRPRIAWAVASALIIAFGFFALYLVVNRGADVQPVADIHPPVTEQPASTATLPTATPAGAGTTQKRAEDKPRSSQSVKRSPLVAARVQNSSSTEGAKSLPADDATPAESPLRVEMQTKDPNIRIIWFSQSNSKPALPNSKGI